MSLSPSFTTAQGSRSWATLERKVLTSIFQHTQYTTEDESFEENTRPNRPYLGRVCRPWHEVWCAEASLLAGILIYVDSNNTYDKLKDGLANSGLPTYLSLSDPHHFTIYLLRKVKVPDIATLNRRERFSIKSILTALVPHFRRVVGLFIEANASSSLPSISDLLSANSSFVLDNLKSLMLTSICDDSATPSPSRRVPLSMPSLRAASLKYLNLDGANIMVALNAPFHLFHCISQLEGLTVNHLTPRVDGFSMVLVDELFSVILDTLPNLQNLGFDELEMPLDATSCAPPAPLRPYYVQRLVIRMTASPSIQYIFHRITHPTEVVLTGCFFTLPMVILPRSTRLVLESTVDFALLPAIRLEATTSIDLLPTIILEWDGPMLEFHSCRALDNTFLDRLFEAVASSTKCLQNLRTLKILNCPGFSAEAILKFLEFRKYLNGHAGGDCLLLDCVEVSEGSPMLENPEQRRDALALVSGTLRWPVV